MAEDVKNNANIHGRFTTRNVSNCNCDDQHKVITQIQSNFAPMRHQDFYNSQNIKNKICQTSIIFSYSKFEVRFNYFPPIKYLLSHAFLKCSFNCTNCNYSGDFVVEYSDKGIEINFGSYENPIFRNNDRLKNIQISYFHLLNIVSKLKRKGYRKKDYGKIKNNCWKFVQSLGDELERFIVN